MSAIIEINNLVKRYKELIALDHFNLEVNEGEIFGLLGPNGSGKTTTINCILSLLTYDKGDIKVFGEKMTPSSYELKRQIGVVMQDVAVFDELTVYENVDYFCGLYVSDKDRKKQYVKEAIEFVGLEDFSGFRPKKLSGGLLRRLNIACGIAHKPKLIFFDEPTVAVDPQSRNNILKGIEQLNRDGATIASGTKEELKKMIKNTEKISVEVTNLSSQAMNDIKLLPHAYDVDYSDNVLKVSFSGGSHNLVRILDYMKSHDYTLGRIYSGLPTLNDVFLEITGTELRDNA